MVHGRYAFGLNGGVAVYKDKVIAVVVPAHNEESQIGKVLDTMPKFVDHIVVVDDASTDATAKVVEERKKDDQRIILLIHDSNEGVGGAIATGYKWARDHGVDAAAVMAGDGQMAPEDLPDLLDPVVSGEVDYAKGNRLYSGEAFRIIPKVRYFGNSILTLLTKIASGYWHIVDSQTGYTVIGRRALKTIDWDSMYKRYGQPNDLLVRLNIEGFKVRDVPIQPVYNVGEKSGIKVYKVVFSISWLLFKRFWWRLFEKYVIRDFHPLVFFYILGCILLIMSLGFFGHVMWLWGKDGHVPEMSALAWMFTFASGLQSLFFAMWFDMEYNKELR